MKCLLARFGTALLVLLAAAASQIRADYLNWTYTSSPNVPGVSVGSSSPSGGATVTLTDFSTPQPGAASIPVIAYVTSTASTTPITFGSGVDTPSTYSLALTITDGATHDSGTLTFTGSLAGALTASSSSVVASFAPVATNALTLDGHTYTVNIPSVTLASPTSPQQNVIANVSVSNASSGGGGGGVPEPASLLLGSLGLSCFGVAHLWKRRFVRRPCPPPSA
ncbi:MAG: hypothetical protein ACYC3I_06690 [Gemmataceae bacterium]